MVNIPATTDLIQGVDGNLEAPEIRVWVHPHRDGKSGDDYFQVFESFSKASKFIKSHKGAEEFPLIAFKGYELNIFDMEKAPVDMRMKALRKEMLKK